VYGSRQDPTSAYAAVIPSFITRVLQGEPPVIYGDGEKTRDFTFINDVVTSNILVAESNICGVFNIGGGKQISINYLANLITKISNKKVTIVYKDPRPGDIKHSFADISKARNVFGLN
jgi:UDP-glucose 4-epimerase